MCVAKAMTHKEKSKRRAAEIAGLKEALSERIIATAPDPATSHYPEPLNVVPNNLGPRSHLCRMRR